MQDCGPIFDEHYSDEYLAQIMKKRVVNSKANQVPLYKNYELSCKALEAGISATKMNFSDARTKNVTIRLVNNRTAI